ncbi:MAG: hypothetical protein GEV09_25765 [Pseudonocardiaceae bacterium]|nr:hypothetical protein [Pseudonocardiaceae bacterium]
MSALAPLPWDDRNVDHPTVGPERTGPLSGESLVSVLVGGVGELFQGDLDLGRRAVDRLATENLGHGVLVEELHYGAVAVAQRLDELRPTALVLVGATQRHRSPGTVDRRRIFPVTTEPFAVHRAVSDAVTGYVSIDLVTQVAAGLQILPARTVTVEVEPRVTEPSEQLSHVAAEALEQALTMVRREVGRIPLLTLADELRGLLAEDRLDGSPALDCLRRLLDTLVLVDRHGRWGLAFTHRDQLRRLIARGATSQRMTSVDWCLWWTLIDELDRLQTSEARDPAAAD